MPKFKINSIKGKQRTHSVLTEFVPFINGVMEVAGLKPRNIGSQKIVRYNYMPLETIEVRQIVSQGSKHHIILRTYGKEYYQNLVLIAHRDRFPDIINYINQYCSRRD